MKMIRRTSAEPKRLPASVRATVVNVERSNESRQIELLDVFDGIVTSVNGSALIPTPYNTTRLFDFLAKSNMLRQCIESMVTNTVLVGWEVDSTMRGRAMSLDEAHELQSFIDNANTEESLVGVLEKEKWDRETCGFGFVEVIRDAAGQLALLRHAPSLYTRLTTRHPQLVLAEQQIMRGRRITTVREFRKFRKFVQIINGRYVWFKEFGDPRRMNSETGYFESDEQYKEGPLATELLHFKQPSPEAYGTPKWVNQLPNIIGSREAEEVNMRYFQENTVPPMMLLVGNGRLTAASYQDLLRSLNSEGVGKERQNKIILLEAVGESDSLDGKQSNIDLKIEKLTDTRQSDGLFKSYDDGNQSKVRSSFRLPPVLVGMSQDVNFATANTSVFVAESQVFAPDRSKTDEFLNKLVVNGPHGLGLKTVKLVSRTPSITSPEMVVKTLTAVNVMGAITPRTAQQAVNKMLQVEIPEYPKAGDDGYEEWMDKPMMLGVQDAKTHDAQNQKTDQQKETENTGETVQPPKHGQE